MHERFAVAERADAPSPALVVQPMVDPGVETIVGVLHDLHFGPVVMFGIGGVATDLLGDRGFRILPLTDVDAHDLVRSLRASPLLFGHRGAEPVDAGQLEEFLLRVAALAVEVPEIAELDLNPVAATPNTVTAVDIKVRLQPAPSTPSTVLRSLD